MGSACGSQWTITLLNPKADLFCLTMIQSPAPHDSAIHNPTSPTNQAEPRAPYNLPARSHILLWTHPPSIPLPIVTRAHDTAAVIMSRCCW